MSISGKNTMELIIAARDHTKGAFGKIGTQMRGTKTSAAGLNSSFKGLKGSMGNLSGAAGKLAGALGPLGIAGVAVAASAAIGLFAASSVKAFAAFEDSMANVRKTTGMTKEETSALGNEIDTMALRLPVAHAELAKIAAVAGQLGIQGSENILGFTETIAKMSTAFDMSAEDVATAMAKLANIYDIPLEQIGNMGSAINVLGNTTAASEAQLMDFAMSLGPTGQQLGFTYEQTMALGASMIEMGVNSSDAGTRLNRAFSKIGQNISELSKFMGVSSEEFANSFDNMPMETFTSVLQKLSQIEGSLEANTVATTLFGEVGAKSVKSLIGNLGGLETNLSGVTTGFKENTSLTEEFAAKTDTLKAKFALVSNAAESFKINLGQALAPLTGIIAEGISKAINGLSKAFDAMQKVAGPVISLLLIRFTVLKAFLEGLFEPIINALKPLSGLFGDTSGAISNLNVVLNVMNDVFTIITGVAKTLGTILGTLIAKAITPLVAKIKEGITALTEFYDKLGPVKGLIEGIKDKVGAGATAIGEWADSFEEAAPAAEDLTEAVSELAKEAEKMAPALSESIKTLESSLTEASGSYKAAIGDITKEITTLKDAWNLASDDQKKAIEDQIDALEDIKSELEDGEEAQKAYFDTTIEGTEEAAEAQKEFKVTIGDTTITFKDMAAEVVKNADAYADLQKNAEQLLDLDWSVFTELKAELPAIDVGISDMASAFSSLKEVLEENITELETVKESVMDIGEISAPFLEAGFLDGINAIGNFAGALSDAGAAINTFGNIQEINTRGCKDFSRNIRDMVTALEILENQIADLVPSFERMGELTTAIAKGFLGNTSYINETGEAAEHLGEIFEGIQKRGSMWDLDPWGHKSFSGISELMKYMGATNEQAQELIQHLGTDLQREMVKLGKESNSTSEFIEKLNESNLIMGLRLDINTTKLQLQTGQLVKITDALTPYLNFMRTLNELAALSAVSSEALNSGLTAIGDTLINLSKALSEFDITTIFEWIKKFALDWSEYVKGMEEAFITFEDAINIFSMMAAGIDSLNAAFLSLKDTTIITERDISRAIQNTEVFINRFVKALSLNFDSLVDSLVDLDIEWSRHAKEMEKSMPSYKHATSSIGTLIGSLTSLSSALKSVAEAGIITEVEFNKGFTSLIGSIGNFATSLSANVDPLIGSLLKLRSAWIENEAVLVPLMVDIINIAKSFTSVAINVNNMVIAFDMLSKNSGSLEKGFGTLITFINQVQEATKKFYTQESARAITQYILDIGLVIAAFEFLGDELENATSDIERTVKNTVKNVAGTVLSLKTLIPNMFVYGANMMFAFAAGMNAYKSVLEGVLISISNMIKGYLGVASPTEFGALKDIEAWPKNLVKTFASGIKSEMGTLNASFGGMALPAPGSGSSSSNVTHISFAVTQNITDKATADYSTRELERMLSRHEML